METAFIAWLLARSALSAIVADRINFGRRAQGGALPALVLHRIDAERDYHHAGPSGLIESRLQIDCWAEDQDDTASGDTLAKDLAKALIAEVSGARFTSGGTRFDAIFVADENDDTFDESGSALYRTRVDLIIHHATA